MCVWLHRLITVALQLINTASRKQHTPAADRANASPAVQLSKRLTFWEQWQLQVESTLHTHAHISQRNRQLRLLLQQQLLVDSIDYWLQQQLLLLLRLVHHELLLLLQQSCLELTLEIRCLLNHQLLHVLAVLAKLMLLLLVNLL
jgi:hypothetical protein